MDRQWQVVSALVESNFNSIKNVVFKHITLPIRCDDFLKIRIKSLKGSIECTTASVRASSNNKFFSSNEKFYMEHLIEKDLEIIKVKENNFIEKSEEHKEDDEIL